METEWQIHLFTVLLFLLSFVLSAKINIIRGCLLSPLMPVVTSLSSSFLTEGAGLGVSEL